MATRHIFAVGSGILLLAGVYYLIGALLFYGSAADLKEEQNVVTGLFVDLARYDFEKRAMVLLLLGGLGASLSAMLFRRHRQKTTARS